MPEVLVRRVRINYAKQIFLDKDYAAPGRRCFNRGREPASATTDDDNVEGDFLRHGNCLARSPAVVPAILPNTEPFIRPVPPG
jgi:hypothetical protein